MKVIRLSQPDEFYQLKALLLLLKSSPSPKIGVAQPVRGRAEGHPAGNRSKPKGVCKSR